MEVYHQKKNEKYEPVSTSIKSNGLAVYLFVIEVGASVYCSVLLISLRFFG